MNWIRSLSLILFCLILYTLTASANREEREVQWESVMIHIPRKASFSEGESTGKLIVPTALEDIESLVINREKNSSSFYKKRKIRLNWKEFCSLPSLGIVRKRNLIHLYRHILFSSNN